jgi:hypothetical protein
MPIYTMIYTLYGLPLMRIAIIRLVIERRRDEMKDMKLRPPFKDEGELIKLATKKYHVYCTINGFVELIPNGGSSHVDHNNVIHLQNVNGELATYRYYPETDSVKKL